MLVSDDLDHLRETYRIFRITYAHAPTEEEMRALRELPGSKNLEREGRGVRLRMRGDVGAVKARPHQLLDVDSTGMGLEEIFVSYVEEGSDAR